MPSLVGVAPEDAGDAAEAERRDVLAQQRARLRAVVDEQREGRAARERLEPERAGAGEEIEHARAGDRIAVGVDEDVEQGLAQPVGGRPDRPRVRLRRGERAAAQPPADDAHQRPAGRARAGGRAASPAARARAGRCGRDRRGGACVGSLDARRRFLPRHPESARACRPAQAGTHNPALEYGSLRGDDAPWCRRFVRPSR